MQDVQKLSDFHSLGAGDDTSYLNNRIVYLTSILLSDLPHALCAEDN
jgi:hypothetical protein